MLDEEVDQRSVGGDGQETRDRGGGHHGEGGVALPPIGPEMLQNCCDLDSFMRHVVCCHGEIHVNSVVALVALSLSMFLSIKELFVLSVRVLHKSK